jgi:hypothetical protein
MDDLMLKEFVRPQGTDDDPSTPQTIEVTLLNSDKTIYQDVRITAKIETVEGELLQNVASDIITRIDLSELKSHVFSKAYTVPANYAEYYVKVYITSVDNYTRNDTLRLERHAPVGVSNAFAEVFTVGQNIPNPAKNTTKIAYTIPSSGEIVFNLQTVSGQILHTEVLQSEAGKQFIELNTTDFAAGIYFYSIEYQGQKIVKRMSIKN